MYLKRLDIKGFKSFAEYTSIEFEPGINIVVGPNGCGKSNVVDAVRWVLGENNVRNLRGQKGEDIIFCGTDSKRAHGMAAVEMLIDNGDAFLPLAYEEINLTRKLFRSGESEFSINRARVRMKDVHDLFAGTGLGKKGYAIISQGELDQLLNAQALDRRLILEEASGIIKYRQQREEVKRRLESTAQDLVRLGDLLQEMRERSLELQHKAEQAKQYLHCKQQADGLEQTLLACEITRIEKDQVARRNDLKERTTLLHRLQEDQRQQSVRIREKEAELDQFRLQAQTAAQQLYDVQTHLAELRSSLQLSQERVRNYGDRLKSAEGDAGKYAAQMQKIEQELTGNHEDYRAQQLLYEELEQHCLAIECDTVSLEQSLVGETQLFEAHKAELFAHTREESFVKNSINEEQERMVKNQERQFRLETQREQLVQQLKQAQHLEATHQEEKALIVGRLTELQASINMADQARTEALQQVAHLDKLIQEQQRGLSQAKARLESLKGLRESYSGYAPGVKTVMQWAVQGELKGILGVVGEILEVPPGLETAIDIAAGRSLDNIVVENSNDARLVIELLKSRRRGRVTFLPLDNLRTRRVPDEVLNSSLKLKGVVGSADRLVKCQPRYAIVAAYLLGRILVVDSLPNAMQVFKKTSFPWTLVTLEGDIINSGGAMSGGVHADRGPSRLQRRAEENQLTALVLNQEAQIEQAKHSLVSSRFLLEDIDRRTEQLNKEHIEHTLKKDWLDNQIKVLAEETGRWLEQSQEVSGELSRLQNESSRIKTSVSDLEEQYRSLQKQQDAGSSQLEAQKDKLVKMRQELGVLKERASSYQEQLHMKKRELDNHHKNLMQFEAVKSSYQLSWQEAQDLLVRLTNDTDIENRRIEDFSREIEQERQRAQSRQEQLELLKQGEEQLRIEVNQLKNSLTPIAVEKERIEQGVRQQELHLARLEVELDGLNSQWQEKVGDVPVTEAGRTDLKASELRNIKQELAILKENLESLGPVDVSAIEASQALDSKLVFLEKQFSDLGEARFSLLNLLKETERLMSQDFSKFMVLAEQSFARTFTEMFNGGEGRLVSEVGSDLEAGVDIEVKIPGKRVQSLPLLSGGERALTCIAFLFALIRLKPAPFCLLDEIDAALDETNLKRFTGFLQGMCHETQFIVVTHRQTTIECGNTIYGVTMAEKGISGVYTLSLEDIPSKAG